MKYGLILKYLDEIQNFLTSVIMEDLDTIKFDENPISTSLNGKDKIYFTTELERIKDNFRKLLL